MRISDWSSDVCSSDLLELQHLGAPPPMVGRDHAPINVIPVVEAEFRVEAIDAFPEIVLDALEVLVRLGKLLARVGEDVLHVGDAVAAVHGERRRILAARSPPAVPHFLTSADCFVCMPLRSAISCGRISAEAGSSPSAARTRSSRLESAALGRSRRTTKTSSLPSTPTTWTLNSSALTAFLVRARASQRASLPAITRTS